MKNKEEDLNWLAGLPDGEIYLHGVIAGKDERIAKMYTYEQVVTFSKCLINEVNNGNHNINIKKLLPH